MFHTTRFTRFFALIFFFFLFPLYCSVGPFVKRIHTNSREEQVTLIAIQIVSDRKKLPRLTEIPVAWNQQKSINIFKSLNMLLVKAEYLKYLLGFYMFEKSSNSW